MSTARTQAFTSPARIHASVLERAAPIYDVKLLIGYQITNSSSSSPAPVRPPVCERVSKQARKVARPRESGPQQRPLPPPASYVASSPPVPIVEEGSESEGEDEEEVVEDDADFELPTAPRRHGLHSGRRVQDYRGSMLAPVQTPRYAAYAINEFLNAPASDDPTLPIGIIDPTIRRIFVPKPIKKPRNSQSPVEGIPCVPDINTVFSPSPSDSSAETCDWKFSEEEETIINNLRLKVHTKRAQGYTEPLPDNIKYDPFEKTLVRYNNASGRWVEVEKVPPYKETGPRAQMEMMREQLGLQMPKKPLMGSVGEDGEESLVGGRLRVPIMRPPQIVKDERPRTTTLETYEEKKRRLLTGSKINTDENAMRRSARLTKAMVEGSSET
ncbi:hypothetical protein LTS18_003971 [Coniosporium uncinatum]|uniref:Uncharacterized protein n=1 Tax=Coniosporium uncinatum TaxID=93489 RepID=A0ACC3DTB0_9PEZI|nr:hypothetical protein LTS18_003971 [Coniosporium uncinatum]